MTSHAQAVATTGARGARAIGTALNQLRQDLIESHHATSVVVSDVAVKQPDAFAVWNLVGGGHRHWAEENCVIRMLFPSTLFLCQWAI